MVFDVPQQLSSWYLRLSSWYFIKNHYFKVIYCNMHTCVISCRCLKASWSVREGSDAPLGRPRRANWRPKHESKPILEDTKVMVLLHTLFKNRFGKHLETICYPNAEEWRPVGTWKSFETLVEVPEAVLEAWGRASRLPQNGSKPAMHGRTDLQEFEVDFHQNVEFIFEGCP